MWVRERLEGYIIILIIIKRLRVYFIGKYVVFFFLEVEVFVLFIIEKNMKGVRFLFIYGFFNWFYWLVLF